MRPAAAPRRPSESALLRRSLPLCAGPCHARGGMRRRRGRAPRGRRRGPSSLGRLCRWRLGGANPHRTPCRPASGAAGARPRYWRGRPPWRPAAVDGDRPDLPPARWVFSAPATRAFHDKGSAKEVRLVQPREPRVQQKHREVVQVGGSFPPGHFSPAPLAARPPLPARGRREHAHQPGSCRGRSPAIAAKAAAAGAAHARHHDLPAAAAPPDVGGGRLRLRLLPARLGLGPRGPRCGSVSPASSLARSSRRHLLSPPRLVGRPGRSCPVRPAPQAPAPGGRPAGLNAAMDSWPQDHPPARRQPALGCERPRTQAFARDRPSAPIARRQGHCQAPLGVRGAES